MIKKVQVFRASDGTDFDNEKKANIHEEMLIVSRDIKSKIISERKETCDFHNGSGYYQLEPIQVNELEKDFLSAVKKYHPSFAKYPLRSYGLCRYLSDYSSPLYSVCCLIERIDKKNRLWGQPYFAYHPEEGRAKNKKLN